MTGLISGIRHVISHLAAARLPLRAAQLSPQQFYRVTRQYLINFSAVVSVEHYFSRKLRVHLAVQPAEDILVNKNNTRAFMEWLERR